MSDHQDGNGKNKKTRSKISFDQFEARYVPARAAKLLTGVSHNTLRKWAKNDALDSFTTPTGQTLYNKDSLLKLVDQGIGVAEEKERKSIVYARVSSKHQMGDMGRQIDLLKSEYPGADLVTDVASGLNFKRKGLQAILELAMRGELKEVVVAHKDRLCRFGADLVEWILEVNGANLIVLASQNGSADGPTASTEQELATDLLSIVHVYACKQMGRRRYKNKIEACAENQIVRDETAKANSESMAGCDEVRVESDPIAHQTE